MWTEFRFLGHFIFRSSHPVNGLDVGLQVIFLREELLADGALVLLDLVVDPSDVPSQVFVVGGLEVALGAGLVLGPGLVLHLQVDSPKVSLEIA